MPTVTLPLYGAQPLEPPLVDPPVDELPADEPPLVEPLSDALPLAEPAEEPLADCAEELPDCAALLDP